MKRFIFTAVLVQLLIVSGNANIKSENWKINVRGAVFSTPVIHNNTIYVGTEEGYFYMINANTGKVIHEVKTGSPIRSNALVTGGNVFIESSGDLYCFDINTAEKKYVVSPEEERIDMTDPWDYFHSSPVEHNRSVFYTGHQGKIYEVNPENGTIIKQIQTPENAIIRSALTFDGNILYFGDNNGIVYRYDMVKRNFTMIHKTYSVRPYSTYGFITGGPFVYKDLLVFSNRNETFTVLNVKTENIEWKKADVSGSWWPAGPVITGKKVIIGGSDNFTLSALDIYSGENIWSFNTDYNIFCTPLVTDSVLIVGTGNSYLNRKGKGSVFSIDIETGRLINKLNPGGNVFSSPVKFKNSIIICTTSGNICSIREDFFSRPESALVRIDGDAEFAFLNDSSSIMERQLKVINSGEKAVKLNYTVNTNGSFPASLLKVLYERDGVYAQGDQIICLQFNRGDLETGQYKGEITFIIDKGRQTIIKPFIIKVQGQKRQNEPVFEVSQFKGDSIDGSAKYNIRIYRKTDIKASLVSTGSDTIKGFMPQYSNDWGIYRIENDIYSPQLKKIEPGRYKLTVRSQGQKVSYDFTVHRQNLPY